MFGLPGNGASRLLGTTFWACSVWSLAFMVFLTGVFMVWGLGRVLGLHGSEVASFGVQHAGFMLAEPTPHASTHAC